MLKKNDIINALIDDSLGEPRIASLPDYPEYTATIHNPLVLRGIDQAELRVLEVDEEHKKLRVCFHASVRLNPKVSTGRAILLAYISMRNTAYHAIWKLFFGWRT